jgi:hypothetical protein
VHRGGGDPVETSIGLMTETKDGDRIAGALAGSAA